MTVRLFAIGWCEFERVDGIHLTDQDAYQIEQMGYLLGLLSRPRVATRPLRRIRRLVEPLRQNQP